LVFAVLEFELRALSLQGRHSTLAYPQPDAIPVGLELEIF
jgi:hypothetical protein